MAGPVCSCCVCLSLCLSASGCVVVLVLVMVGACSRLPACLPACPPTFACLPLLHGGPCLLVLCLSAFVSVCSPVGGCARDPCGASPFTILGGVALACFRSVCVALCLSACLSVCLTVSVSVWLWVCVCVVLVGALLAPACVGLSLRSRRASPPSQISRELPVPPGLALLRVVCVGGSLNDWLSLLAWVPARA